MSRASAKPRLILALVALFIAVQVAFPLLKLDDERPSRFSWQMYAGSRTRPTFFEVYADGSTNPFEYKKVIGVDRRELDLAPALTNFVCDSKDNVVALQVVRGDDVENIPC